MSDPKVSGWVIYYAGDGKPGFYGIMQDKVSADAELEILNRHGGDWRAREVKLIGWGIFLSDDNKPKPKGN